MARSIYICDKKRCEDCSYPICKFTTDIEHQLKIKNCYKGDILYERLYDAAEDLLNGVYDIESLAELLLDARNVLIHYQFTPTEKVGHWDWVQYHCDPTLGDWVCSECKSVVVEGVQKYDKDRFPTYKFCPQCGDVKCRR